jgi:hypothetical protein
VLPATIWSGALQAAATVVGQRQGDARWEPADAAREIVKLACHIIGEMPDDSVSGTHVVKAAAQKWFDKKGQ